MSSESEAEEILAELLRLLDEDNLRIEIDARIDHAAHTFRASRGPDLPLQSFHKVLAELTCHLYRHGLRTPQRLSRQQGVAEAISLLHQGYLGAYGSGYDAAYLDALRDGPNGMEGILGSLAETIKHIEREKYVRWAVFSQLDPSDWKMKLQIVQVIMKRWKHLLPTELLRCWPAQLADDFLLLILNYVNTENPLGQLTAPAFPSP